MLAPPSAPSSLLHITPLLDLFPAEPALRLPPATSALLSFFIVLTTSCIQNLRDFMLLRRPPMRIPAPSNSPLPSGSACPPVLSPSTFSIPTVRSPLLPSLKSLTPLAVAMNCPPSPRRTCPPAAPSPSVVASLLAPLNFAPLLFRELFPPFLGLRA